ncbi:hypothetical protein ACF0H5_014375 [Mactra antiquata]
MVKHALQRMENEIWMRTNKSEYCSGEEIYGVVYLRILTPTKGCGIEIKFRGYEKFEYKEKNDPLIDAPQVYTGYRHYINCNEVLYRSEEPFCMCSTLFPFKIPLPVEIPGTFSMSHDDEFVSWSCKVEYCLEVKVTGASQLKRNQSINIRQPLSRLSSYPNPPQAVTISCQDNYLWIFKNNIGITARLHEHIHRAGENLKLRVIISNNDYSHVQTLKIQLERTITFTHRPTNLDLTEDKSYIEVENRVKVGREMNIEMIPYPNGLDNIQIPLKNVDKSAVCPSVRGEHVICFYEVLVTVLLVNGNSYDLRVPVSVVIAEKDEQWHLWTAPEWLDNDTINVQHNTDSILRVPENLLSSESFASIPGFHPL